MTSPAGRGARAVARAGFCPAAAVLVLWLVPGSAWPAGVPAP
ncbi:MAG TPA: hypothetical protein VGQ05_09660 [Streptosporangiaceae bacterium]|nr:hypothetical protein [Streptosporangiaceae bacterium]